MDREQSQEATLMPQGTLSCLGSEFLCILAGSAAQNSALRVLGVESLWCLVGVVVVSGVRSFLVLSLLL